MLFFEKHEASGHKINQWSGGTTCELYIYPPESQYQRRDFQVRISTATVSDPLSTFTSLSGFMRHIMLLEGEMNLRHKDQYDKQLRLYETDFFSGDWVTISEGMCRDFNLMLAESWQGKLAALSYTQKVTCFADALLGCYVWAETCQLDVFKENEKIKRISLQQGDFLIFPPNQGSEFSIEVVESKEMDINQPALIYAMAWK